MTSFGVPSRMHRRPSSCAFSARSERIRYVRETASGPLSCRGSSTKTGSTSPSSAARRGAQGDRRVADRDGTTGLTASNEISPRRLESPRHEVGDLTTGSDSALFEFGKGRVAARAMLGWSAATPGKRCIRFDRVTRPHRVLLPVGGEVEEAAFNSFCAVRSRFAAVNDSTFVVD